MDLTEIRWYLFDILTRRYKIRSHACKCMLVTHEHLKNHNNPTKMRACNPYKHLKSQNNPGGKVFAGVRARVMARGKSHTQSVDPILRRFTTPLCLRELAPRSHPLYRFLSPRSLSCSEMYIKILPLLYIFPVCIGFGRGRRRNSRN